MVKKAEGPSSDPKEYKVVYTDLLGLGKLANAAASVWFLWIILALILTNRC